MALDQFIVLPDELLRAKLFDLFPRFYPINLEVRFDQFARSGNILRGVELITCQHPYFDIGLMEVVDPLWHILLKPILESSGSKQGQICLKLRVELLGSNLDSIKRVLDILKLDLESVNFILIEYLHSEKQSSKALSG